MVYRTSDVEFGIVPLPKFDENQDNYYTLNTSGFMIVPATAASIDMIGMTTELLGCENRKTVMPAFYDLVLQQKVSRDSDSEKMLDLIFTNSVYSLDWNLWILN